MGDEKCVDGLVSSIPGYPDTLKVLDFVFLDFNKLGQIVNHVDQMTGLSDR